jgi:hypothetical protein
MDWLGDRRTGNRECAQNSLEQSALALGIIHGLVRISHGANQFDQVAVFNATIFVNGHGQW